MIEPYRQRSGLEYHAFRGWRPLADELGDDAGIRCALAAPDPFTCSADRDCRLFHRHVETNIFFHGCSPFDAWARRRVVSPYFHPIGEQPLIEGRLAPAITPCGRLLHGHESAMDLGAVKAPTIWRSYPCKRSRWHNGDI